VGKYIKYEKQSLLSCGQKLSSVNGVLFTGGSEKQGVYFETIKKVFQVDCDFEYSYYL